MSLKTRTALFLAVTCGLVAVQFSVLRALYVFSRADESASHLIIIPLVSAVLVWYERDRVFSSVRTDWTAGLATLAAGLAVAVAARMGGHDPAGQSALTWRVAALLLMWIGSFLLVFGRRAAAAARFAVGILVFTIPIPAVLLDGVVDALKRGSTEAAGALFSLSGAPYHRDGFVFSLPGVSIQVADECSGIRSTIALVLTALLAGHMFLANRWSKLVLLLAILPITVLKNGLRIVTLGLLASYVDPGILASPLHRDGGILFFVLALSLLSPLLALLRRRESAIPQPDLLEEGVR